MSCFIMGQRLWTKISEARDNLPSVSWFSLAYGHSIKKTNHYTHLSRCLVDSQEESNATQVLGNLTVFGSKRGRILPLTAGARKANLHNRVGRILRAGHQLQAQQAPGHHPALWFSRLTLYAATLITSACGSQDGHWTPCSFWVLT